MLITNATSDAGLSAARSLVRAGYDVASADVVHMPYGVKSRFISDHHVLANDSADAYATALIDLVDRIRPDALLPMGARSALASAAVRERLEIITALNVPDREAIAVANDKSALIASLDRLGIPCAQIHSYPEAVRALSENAELTLVVKPRANVGSARGVQYVKTRRELDDAIVACRANYGDALIQEFVPGGPETMKTALLLYSRDSRLVAALTTAKKRQWPTTGGLTVVSRSTRDEAIIEQVKPFFDHWKWKGPAEVEIKCDARTGVNKVIEINPRFPAYFRFAERCGLDLATIAVRLALKEDVTPLDYPAYRVGVTYVNPALLMKSASWDIITDLGAGFQCAMDMLRDPLPLLGRVLHGLRSTSPR